MVEIKDITKAIGKAVDGLDAGLKNKDAALLKELIGLTKTLETRGDTILNNVKNFGVINKIKIALERLIIDKAYSQQLTEFVKSYTDIQDLSNKYFAQFNALYTPKKAITQLRSSAIETTLVNLTEAGIEVGVIDGIKKILITNVNNGGSYADLLTQLKSYVLPEGSNEGLLRRYVKTYATTAINQFSAEYNQAIAADLGLEWYMYTGSLLTTSRAFCEKCVEKKYIHISEFPKILKGDFGELGTIKVSDSTGLPFGLMAGTDEKNLVRRRGGWNCGHQMIAVSETMVPKAVRDTVYASLAYKQWKVAA